MKMLKKKDKKKFKRKNIKLQNLKIGNLEHFDGEDIIEEKRAEKKLVEKGETSSKSFLNLKKGRIIEVKSNYQCMVKIENKKIICSLSGRLKQINFETRTLVAPGDYVNVNVSEDPRIEEILPRKNALSRFSLSDFQTEIVIASNIDQVVITSSFKEPELKTGLIDRYICAAGIFGLFPVICINKIDLAKDIQTIKTKLEFYIKNNFEIIFTSAKNNIGIEKLRNIVKGKDTVFSGHSGAGKSSIINLLQPDLNLKVAEISDFSQKGTHTTSNGRLIEWSFGGYLIDTPGIKTFGLHRKDKEEIPRLFPGFSSLAETCKFQDCTHIHEKNCSVKAALENGSLPKERYDSYLRIMESL